jgi:hypothetical protein
MSYKLKTKNYSYSKFSYEKKMTQKYLNPFTTLEFRNMLYEELNGKAFPKIILTLKFETNEENIVTSAKVSWEFHENELERPQTNEIFYYNRDKSQGKINSHIDAVINKYFNTLSHNELIAKLLKDVTAFNSVFEEIN